MSCDRPILAGTTADALAAWCKTHALAPFRARQIRRWITAAGVLDPQEMLNLPADLRAMLAAEFLAPASRVAEACGSGDGVTKLRLELYDHESVEVVLIPTPERLTFCLSTQVGCPVGCRFCASGSQGLVRNLAAGEILEEFLLGARQAGRRPDNIVFMGIGEGLLNFRELKAALNELASPEGFGMSPRRITVSTSGYVPGMREFAGLRREFNLAVSLHGATDEVRARLIPDALRYPVADVLAAADLCREANGREYTIEYTLVSGVNDSLEDAAAIAALAKQHRAKINLIPLNSTGLGGFKRPASAVIQAFERAVAAAGARVTRRVERGSGKLAACGQLRISHNQEKLGDE